VFYSEVSRSKPCIEIFGDIVNIIRTCSLVPWDFLTRSAVCWIRNGIPGAQRGRREYVRTCWKVKRKTVFRSLCKNIATSQIKDGIRWYKNFSTWEVCKKYRIFINKLNISGKSQSNREDSSPWQNSDSKGIAARAFSTWLKNPSNPLTTAAQHFVWNFETDSNGMVPPHAFPVPRWWEHLRCRARICLPPVWPKLQRTSEIGNGRNRYGYTVRSLVRAGLPTGGVVMISLKWNNGDSGRIASQKLHLAVDVVTVPFGGLLHPLIFLSP